MITLWESKGDPTNLIADLTRLLLVLVRIELLSENGEVGLMSSQTCCWGKEEERMRRG